VLDANAWAGGYELDLVLRRGSRLVFCEVKAKRGARYGDPLEMVGREKLRRLSQAAETWLAAHPECARLEARFEAVGIRDGRLVRVDAPVAD
jgi:putative endonuclease